ncbi:MAG: hypothetical protein ACFCVD_11725 [Nodosilinea sp.]
MAEEPREKRRRLEAWLDEQVRAEVSPLGLIGPKLEKAKQEIRTRSLHNALKLAAATLLNRLVVIRQMEALGLLRTKVVTGGWSSPAYREFRDFAPDLCKDDTEGYGFLLQLLYDELALDLPGLFGRVGLTELFPIPASTLRAVVEALEALDPDAWRDDTTLGWVYQYWNDPEELFLDSKSGVFELEASGIRSAQALERLYLVAAVAILYGTTQGMAVQLDGLRTRVAPHWTRGISYLKIELRWLKGAVNKGRPFLKLIALFPVDPEPCCASKKAEAQHYDRIWFSRIQSLCCQLPPWEAA